MRRSLLAPALFGILFGPLGFSAPLFAHHGTVGYDNKMITLMGTVTDFEFTNPHILIHIDAEDSNGNVQHWTVETVPPSIAIHTGWSRDMMKRGDAIRYDIRPAKNGSFIGRGGNKVMINGKSLGE